MKELALFGGQPVRTTPFPAWPPAQDHSNQRIEDVIRSGQWGVGSTFIAEFNERFAAWQDAKYCIATNSGTTALWVALKAAGIAAGDEVILPAYTFIATASAVMMANAVPVFVDIDPVTLNIDTRQIEAAITAQTKAIIPVHIGGNPADLDGVEAIARKHNLVVIEDAAQAHGAEWKGRKVGAIGLGGIFSFQTSKNLSAGEGGAIVTNDESFTEACFSYHNCGRVRGGKWYEHSHLGGNFRFNAFGAALLLEQLEHLAQMMDCRDAARSRLDETLGQIDGITTIKRYPGTTREANHIYLLKYDAQAFHGIHRNIFFKAMQAEGVYTYGGYTPLYRERLFITNDAEYPWLKGRDYQNLKLPVTERIADEEVVWLKQNHLLGTEDDIKDIITAFDKVTTALKQHPEEFRGLEKTL
ncbi:MAG: DegT/DnrJ/EryC1/StrS family aminotransferase [Fidelibacterota bacterium]